MKCLIQARNPFAPFAAIRALQLLLAAVALGTVISLRAESPTTPQGVPDPQNEQMQAARQLHADYIELQQRLEKIQQRVMKVHPELQKQEQDLQVLIMSKMTSSTGVNAKQEMAAINEIEQKLDNKDTPESERQKLMPEYQKRAKAFRDAQIQAAQDSEVQQAWAALINATTAAMKQEDPQTEQLMEQLKQKQSELQKLMETGGRAK
jgi:hypothetical protein